MRFAQASAAGLFLLALPLLIITTNVRFAGTETLLWQWGFDRYDAAKATGIDRPQLDRAANEMVEYFGDDQPYLRTRVVVDGRIEPLFNPRETAHMADVKDLFQLVFFVQELSLGFVLTYVIGVFVWAGEGSVRALARQVLASVVVLAGIAIAFAGAAAIGFEPVFEQFHLLSFSNDFWKLNPRTDHLIQMFPEDFFFDMALLIAALTIIEAGALAGGSWWYLRRQRGGPEPALHAEPAYWR